MEVDRLFWDFSASTAFLSCKKIIAFLMLNSLKKPGEVNACK